MALEVLHYGGYIDGDLNLDPASADYVAGQPAEITAAGVKITIDDTKFLGLLKNDKSEDAGAGVGPQAADTTPTSPAELARDVGVVCGTNKVRLTPGVTLANTASAPFVYPGTAGAWAEGQEIFNNGAGKWDNQTAGGSVARGRVTKAPLSATDEMHVYMYR